MTTASEKWGQFTTSEIEQAIREDERLCALYQSSGLSMRSFIKQNRSRLEGEMRRAHRSLHFSRENPLTKRAMWTGGAIVGGAVVIGGLVWLTTRKTGGSSSKSSDGNKGGKSTSDLVARGADLDVELTNNECAGCGKNDSALSLRVFAFKQEYLKVNPSNPHGFNMSGAGAYAYGPGTKDALQEVLKKPNGVHAACTNNAGTCV